MTPPGRAKRLPALAPTRLAAHGCSRRTTAAQRWRFSVSSGLATYPGLLELARVQLEHVAVGDAVLGTDLLAVEFAAAPDPRVLERAGHIGVLADRGESPTSRGISPLEKERTAYEPYEATRKEFIDGLPQRPSLGRQQADLFAPESRAPALPPPAAMAMNWRPSTW